MMAFRVTMSYPMTGDRPNPADLERLQRSLEAAAPDAGARFAFSISTLDVALTVESLHQVDAIAQALSVADAVVADASIRAHAQPIPCPVPRTPDTPATVRRLGPGDPTRPVRPRRAAMELHIVVVDDHEPLRGLLRSLLTDAGHVVVAEAAGGRDGVRQTVAARPDQVIIDW